MAVYAAEADGRMEITMKFMHIADVHLGTHPEGGLDSWDVLTAVLKRVAAEQVQLLLIAGDLFHRQPLMRELRELDGMFAALPDTEIVCIAGNHDPVTERSAYRRFSWSGNVHFLLRHDLQTLYLPSLDTGICGSSYWNPQESENIYNQKDLKKAAEGMQGTYKILLLHGGDEKHRPFYPSDPVAAGFSYTACGHIHKPEQLVPGKVIMAGAPQPIDTGDFGPHGFWMGFLDSRGVSVHFYPLRTLEYVHAEIEVSPEMTSRQITGLVQKRTEDLRPYQKAAVVLTGYRSWEARPQDETILALPQVEKLRDETRPDYDLQRLRMENRGNLMGDFLEAMAGCPDQELADKAAYYGLEAMFSAGWNEKNPAW